jgi:thiol-disulfide isomerase/thioredoxin
MRVGGKRPGRGAVALAVAAVTLVAGCSVGKDAVDTGANFTFVSPGGKTDILYAVDQRQKSPDLSGDNLEHPGHLLQTNDFANKVVVVNLWGAWCSPCRTEAPQLASVNRETEAEGVQVMGIDVRDDRGQALDYVRNNGLGYPSIFDPAARSLLVLNGYPRSVVPSTIVLDRQHRVAAVYLGQITESKLLAELHSLTT